MLLNFNAALDFYLADLLASAAVEVGRKTGFGVAWFRSGSTRP